MGWRGFKGVYSDPNISEVRNNVLTVASLSIGLGEFQIGARMFTASNIWTGAGVINDIDDLTGASDNAVNQIGSSELKYKVKLGINLYKATTGLKGLRNGGVDMLENGVTTKKAAAAGLDTKDIVDGVTPPENENP